MLTLEKIIELDEKVNNTVQVIEDLRKENQQLKRFQEENDRLKEELKEYQEKIEILEQQVSSCKSEHDSIESGIQRVIHTLDQMLKKSGIDEVVQSNASNDSTSSKEGYAVHEPVPVVSDEDQPQNAEEPNSPSFLSSSLSPTLSSPTPPSVVAEKTPETPSFDSLHASAESFSNQTDELDEPTIENLDIF